MYIEEVQKELAIQLAQILKETLDFGKQANKAISQTMRDELSKEETYCSGKFMGVVTVLKTLGISWKFLYNDDLDILGVQVGDFEKYFKEV